MGFSISRWQPHWAAGNGYIQVQGGRVGDDDRVGSYARAARRSLSTGKPASSSSGRVDWWV